MKQYDSCDRTNIACFNTIWVIDLFKKMLFIL